jgi:hypothetical protein
METVQNSKRPVPAAKQGENNMHDMSTRMSPDEFHALRDLRASTMLRLEADRIHREFVTGSLDQTTAIVVERAVADLGRLGEDIAREKSARIVAKSVGRLADALDADDHNQGRREINHAAPIMVAMAILAGWELGALSPF